MLSPLIPIFTEILAVVFGGLALAAGIRHVRRVRTLRAERERLTDDMIRQVERDGWIALEDDEPLDHEHIREEEERFWEEERWD